MASTRQWIHRLCRQLRRMPARTTPDLVLAVLLVLLVLPAVACGGGDVARTAAVDAASPLDVEAERAAFEGWREERVAELREPEGWLSVVGLEWLDAGEQTIGWSEQADIPLPEGREGLPELLATVRVGPAPEDGAQVVDVRLEDERSTLVVDDGDGGESPAPDLADGWARFSGTPDATPVVIPILDVEGFRIFVLERGEGQFALRIRNTASPRREILAGLPVWPHDPDWVLEGVFEPYGEARSIAIDNTTDRDYPDTSVGRFVFERQGTRHSMELLGDDPAERQLLMVGDLTNGAETNGAATYGGGRYIYVEVEDDGTIRTDWNRLYNPPCVFTPYATCPLPPPENRLPFRIEAGEKLPEFTGGP